MNDTNLPEDRSSGRRSLRDYLGAADRPLLKSVTRGSTGAPERVSAQPPLQYGSTWIGTENTSLVGFAK